LIGFYRQKTDVLRADKAFLITFFGSALLLLGILRFSQQAGSFNLAVIQRYYAGAPLSDITVLLILAGILAKSATLPLQSWLPDAGVAPAPVTALLHAAVLVKIGVYVFARLFVTNLALGVFWSQALPWIAASSALIAAAAAFIETDMKRIIAYSTISQIGFIFFALALGTGIGVAAGLLYILMHGLAKAGLFLCAGIIEQNTHTKDITKLGGLIHTMPRTAFAFLICAFSVMGIPPLGGFFSKYLVFAAGMQSGQLAVTLVFLLTAAATIAYLWRFFALVFLGEVKVAAKEVSPIMVASVLTLAVLSLAGGFLIFVPANLVKAAVAAAVGG
jgi:NADH:ubiquinone oxidoreductase subunit 5 (subunit L)/multisubunit Na+/H+ antiporter MnhA subunit